MAKVKLKQLEGDLEGLLSFSKPNVKLEQYQTPPRFAAEILHHISLVEGITNKVVLDLGCGCGILGFGCVRLGAERVIGVDIDGAAIATAIENRCLVGLDSEFISFIQKDVLYLSKADFPDNPIINMVIMNPPFGTREHENVDTLFVEKGLELAKVVYSIHKSSTRSHWTHAAKVWKERWGWNVTTEAVLTDQSFKIPQMYKFHKKQEQDVYVDLVKFTR